MCLKDIETKSDYAEYEKRVKKFFEREGIQNLSAKSDDEGNTETYFSWRPCHCCGRSLGGDRYECDGYNPQTKAVYEYEVCTDCVYYAVYGRLDDQTMLAIESNE
jgi:hypothetical protein